jgi:hypothetical protein
MLSLHGLIDSIRVAILTRGVSEGPLSEFSGAGRSYYSA